ncbi:MAG: DUF1611 domain-containing protein [Planctomycetota bacterium]
MESNQPECAVVLTHGLLVSPQAKTTHGMIRGPSRWPIACVVDPEHAGGEAGQLLDGKPAGIPVVATLKEALGKGGGRITHCVIGIANAGGVLPEGLRKVLLEAADAGLVLVNGLHEPLADDDELSRRCQAAGGRLLDIRAPRPVMELRFFTGEALALDIPRIAVLGTDCALGKRTTCSAVTNELVRRGVKAEMIFTGQTGWMQGYPFGFILDATPNDFVSGELEGELLRCAEEARPDVMLIEGQSSLRNPTGPCGAELIVSAGASLVILQHAPGRLFYKGLPTYPIPPLEDEIELIGRYGAKVIAVGLNLIGLGREKGEELRRTYEESLGIPVALPLEEGAGRLADTVLSRSRKQ